MNRLSWGTANGLARRFSFFNALIQPHSFATSRRRVGVELGDMRLVCFTEERSDKQAVTHSSRSPAVLLLARDQRPHFSIDDGVNLLLQSEAPEAQHFSGAIFLSFPSLQAEQRTLAAVSSS